MLSCDEMEVRDAADVLSLYDDAHDSPGAPATKDDVLLHLSMGADEIVARRWAQPMCAPSTPRCKWVLRSGCAGAPTTKGEIKVARARKCVSKSWTMHPMCDADALLAQRKLAACTFYITLGDLPTYNNTQIRSLDDG